MNKNPFLFYILALLLCVSFSYGHTYSNFDKSITVQGPEKINVLDRYQVKISINNPDVIKYANLLEIECNGMIILDNEISDSLLLSKGFVSPLKYYQYNGEKEIVLDVASHFHPIPSPNENVMPCPIRFKLVIDEKNEKLKQDLKDNFKTDYLTRYISEVYFNPNTTSIDFNITIPETEIRKDKVTTSISADPKNYNSAIRFYAHFDEYGNNMNFTDGSAVGTGFGNDKNDFFDFKNPDYEKFFVLDNNNYHYEIRKIKDALKLPDDVVRSQKGTSGYYRIHQIVSESSWENKEKGIKETIITTFFNARINYYGSRSMLIGFHNTHRVDKAKVDSEMKRIENDIMNYIKSLEMQSEKLVYPVYSKPQNIKHEKEEIKDVEDRDFKIKIKNNEKTIWNTGRKNTLKDSENTNFEILVNLEINAKDEDGKKIKNPSKEQLYNNVYVSARLLENNSQLGLSSKLSNEWMKKASSDLETIEVFGKGPLFYDGPFKPVEYIEVYLSDEKGNALTEKVMFKVKLKDGTPKITLKKEIVEVQDGDKRGIEFKVSDADSKELKCRITVPTSFAYKSGIPTSYIEYDGKQTTFAEFDCKDSETIKFMYYAPKKIGNFDLNGELSALSMWKLQEGTAVNLVADLVGIGVEKRLKFLRDGAELNQRFVNIDPKDIDSLKRAQTFGSAHDFLDKGNKLSTHTQNVIKVTQTGKNIDNTQKLFNQSVGSGKQGWVEWGADWGVFGIDVAQTAVGVVMMAPSKIPVVGTLAGKVTGKLTLAFNLMTNVWKGNLEYLSKVEKIDRAQLFYLPYPVIIEVEDKDGFKVAEIQNIMIAYNWLE